MLMTMQSRCDSLSTITIYSLVTFTSMYCRSKNTHKINIKIALNIRKRQFKGSSNLKIRLGKQGYTFSTFARKYDKNPIIHSVQR